jgi:hypothetical protein
MVQRSRRRGLAVLVAAIALAMPEHVMGRTLSACKTPRPDSLRLAAPPIYRECDVDRRARLRGSAPALFFSPQAVTSSRGRCFRASLMFVVGADGVPEMGTVRVYDPVQLLGRRLLARLIVDVRHHSNHRRMRPATPTPAVHTRTASATTIRRSQEIGFFGSGGGCSGLSWLIRVIRPIRRI